MRGTIHFEGIASKINLSELLSDNYQIDFSFAFDEESTDTIPNVFFRFYESDEKCTLDEAIKGNLTKMFGDLSGEGQEYGYSEYSIEGFSVNSLQLGGHNLNKIFESKGDKYLHILIDIIPEREKSK